jgi:hypothetical protein
MANAKIANSVLQRNFANGSTMYFSFAFIDAERTRGIPADCVTYDEIQDLDADFMPIIQECMSASDYGMEMFFGTPKTMENTIEVMWEESSQGEWVIKCDACGHWNIPSQHHDLYKMIGKIGPSCARCTRLVNPREGHFRHAFPQNRWILEGHHVPQISMPMHYEDPKRPGEKPTEASEKWVQLLRKYEGKDGYTQGKFANEVLGESCDHGSKLVSMTDLKKGCRSTRCVSWVLTGAAAAKTKRRPRPSLLSAGTHVRIAPSVSMLSGSVARCRTTKKPPRCSNYSPRSNASDWRTTSTGLVARARPSCYTRASRTNASSRSSTCQRTLAVWCDACRPNPKCAPTTDYTKACP